MYVCDYLGMTWTHDLRPKVIQYLFYSTYKIKIHSQSSKIKEYPLIRDIHKTVTNQRRRFMSNADPAFKDLFSLMDTDTFDMDIMTDEGQGSAGPKLMAAVENGTRQMAVRCVHSMGAMAGKDSEQYVRVLVKICMCTCEILYVCTCVLHREK